MLTDQQIHEIRQRAANATPGPWVWESWVDKTYQNQWLKSLAFDENERALDNMMHEVLACVCETFEQQFSEEETVGWDDCPSEEDAQFIAHARNDIPALLADRDAMIAAVRGFIATAKPADPQSTLMAFKSSTVYALATAFEAIIPDFTK